MEIAVLSDIHGNYVALERCVRYALERGIETFLFLGDYLGDLAYPQKTMQFLYSLKETYSCWFIKGNKEDYWLHYNPAWKENSSTTGALYYTYHHLTQQDFSFFGSLTHWTEISFEGLPTITICHGSPDETNEKLLPNTETAYAVLERSKTDYILCGHTHLQAEITHHGKMMWNGGSVGVPLQSQGKAQFLILRSTERFSWERELLSLDYDVERIISDLHSSGLYDKAPCWCIVTENVLRTGENSHGVMLERAMSLCREKTGQCNWPDIPEECWRLALDEIYKGGCANAAIKTI